MQKKNMWMLSLGLGIASGTIIVERFIMNIPDWLGIALGVIAFISIVAYIMTNKK